MKGHPTIIALSMAFLFPSRARAEQPDASEALLQMMHLLNRAIIEASSDVRDRAVSERVRAYARRVELDHRFSERKVLEMGADFGLDVREAERELLGTNVDGAEELREMLEELKALQGVAGSQLDRAFLSTMEAVHARAIAMLSRGAADAAPVVQDLLARQIPIFRQHLDLAVTLMGGSTPRARTDGWDGDRRGARGADLGE